MRLNYYRFAEGTDESILLENGCAVVLKDGDTIYPDSIPDDKRELVDYVDDTIYGCSVTFAKQLLKRYGGSAWTEHIDRNGGCFEVTDITIKGNNSKFKYNHHL